LARSYTTSSGDTWDLVALRTLGAERYMDALIQANPDHRFRARFPAGVVLTIPPLPSPPRPTSLPPWRRSA